MRLYNDFKKYSLPLDVFPLFFAEIKSGWQICKFPASFLAELLMLSRVAVGSGRNSSWIDIWALA